MPSLETIAVSFDLGRSLGRSLPVEDFDCPQPSSSLLSTFEVNPSENRQTVRGAKGTRLKPSLLQIQLGPDVLQTFFF